MCSLSLFLTQSFDPPKQLVQMSAATFPQRFDAQDSTFLQTFFPSTLFNEIEEHRIVQLLIFQ